MCKVRSQGLGDVVCAALNPTALIWDGRVILFMGWAGANFGSSVFQERMAGCVVSWFGLHFLSRGQKMKYRPMGIVGVSCDGLGVSFVLNVQLLVSGLSWARQCLIQWSSRVLAVWIVALFGFWACSQGLVLRLCGRTTVMDTQILDGMVAWICNGFCAGVAVALGRWSFDGRGKPRFNRFQIGWSSWLLWLGCWMLMGGEISKLTTYG